MKKTVFVLMAVCMIFTFISVSNVFGDDCYVEVLMIENNCPDDFGSREDAMVLTTQTSINVTLLSEIAEAIVYCPEFSSSCNAFTALAFGFPLVRTTVSLTSLPFSEAYADNFSVYQNGDIQGTVTYDLYNYGSGTCNYSGYFLDEYTGVDDIFTCYPPDGDSVPYLEDNCREVANQNQSDVDDDGVGDVCDDDTIYGTVSGDVQEGINVSIYEVLCGEIQPHANGTTDTQGYYAIGALANGRYLVAPDEAGYTFSKSHWVDIQQTEIQSYDFTATEYTCDDVDRFLDNGDGTVTDCRTDLVWLKNAGCAVGSYQGARSFVSFFSDDGECDLSDGSISGDWRLPTTEELQGLGTDPLATWSDGFPPVAWTMPSEPFVYVHNASYWSESYCRDYWFADVSLGTGNTDCSHTTGYNWILPIRSGN